PDYPERRVLAMVQHDFFDELGWAVELEGSSCRYVAEVPWKHRPTHNLRFQGPTPTRSSSPGTDANRTQLGPRRCPVPFHRRLVRRFRLCAQAVAAVNLAHAATLRTRRHLACADHPVMAVALTAKHDRVPFCSGWKRLIVNGTLCQLSSTLT